jgi:hypothetical protein
MTVCLLEKLKEQRRSRWENTVEKTNFTHSSRKARNLLKKLGTDSPHTVSPKTVTASIASRLLFFKASLDKNHARSTKRSIRGIKRTLSMN